MYQYSCSVRQHSAVIIIAPLQAGLPRLFCGSPSSRFSVGEPRSSTALVASRSPIVKTRRHNMLEALPKKCHRRRTPIQNWDYIINGVVAAKTYLCQGLKGIKRFRTRATPSKQALGRVNQGGENLRGSAL